MKVPLSWLREYVDFDDDAEGLAHKLTFSGIEVEGIEKVRAGLEGVIVGRITQVSSHPGADRLKLCMVDDGRQTVPVVCGATNMKAGDCAAFAPAGTTLPSGTKIRQAKVRGEESFGMLCAEDELGLSDDHSGIFLVDPQTAPGSSINDVIGQPDEVLDLEITWNRPDCLSILGIAREVAALYGTKVRLPDTGLNESSQDAADFVSVEVKSPEACPRYTGRYLTGVRIAQSPGWMQSRLTACGIRPINNIVDITNYVLLETGHPLHAFDYSNVKDGRIVVRFAGQHEVIKTLDGVERKLGEDILLIADAEKPLAVAGVMGGDGSEICSSTNAVLLESATFSAPGIHNAVTRLGLNSESSHRFERGVDFGWVDFASRRAARLMSELAGATVSRGAVDVHAAVPEERVIRLSMRTVNGVMGIQMDTSECARILSSLEFLVSSDGESLDVTVPGFRGDVTVEADLVEEIARMKGLDAIPPVMQPCHLSGNFSDAISWRREEIRSQLVSLGLTETVNYSFMSEKLAGLMTESQGVPLPNPVSADYCVMRGSLAPQMIDMLGRNLARQNHDCACFEIGKVFTGKGADIREEERICVGVMGHAGRYSLDRVGRIESEEVFLWVKGILESLCSANGRSMILKPGGNSLLEAGGAAEIVIGERQAGWIGVLSGAIRGEYRMLEPVVVAEIDLSTLLELPSKARGIQPIPPFPAVSRDIAVIVDEAVLHEQVLKVVSAIKCPELTRIELFDIFRGKGTGDGRKSMAYSFTFQASDRTLTDDEANGFRDRIRDGLVSKLNAEIREG